MNVTSFIIYLAVMVGVTYMIRALPYLLVQKEIKNVFMKSFLTYIPYTVLAAMTFPAILNATQSLISAVVGLVCAVVLSFFNMGLIKVALGASLAVLVTELLLLVV